jgi:hypothetical protein
MKHKVNCRICQTEMQAELDTENSGDLICELCKIEDEELQGGHRD